MTAYEAVYRVRRERLC